MAKRRTDILDRARELLSAYQDDEILGWIHNPESDEPTNDERWEAYEKRSVVSKRLAEIERQLMDEFGAHRDTVRSQIGRATRERTKKHVYLGDDGLYHLKK